MAIATCIGIPYVFVKYEPPGINALSPATQLSLISTLIAAIVCSYGELNSGLQIPVIIVSYLLIGMGLPLSLGFDSLFMTLFFHFSIHQLLELLFPVYIFFVWYIFFVC